MKKNLFIKKHLKKGFTLIEIMISVAIMTVIMGVVGLFQADIFSMNSSISEGLNSQSANRALIKDFVFELRNATTSQAGDYPLAAAGTSSVVFYSNIDGESDIEKVSYVLDGSDFKKFVIKPTSENIYSEENKILVKEVLNVRPTDTESPADIFQYYASSTDGSFDRAPMSEPIVLNEVRLVKMKLQTNPSIETQVAPRNLKNNF
jgi:prepilin-type N-terminal cleavage/methylation domain-containing protein